MGRPSKTNELSLFQRGNNWFIRGKIKGPAGERSIYESTGTSDRERANAIRIQVSSRLLEETLHGPKATKTFNEAADSYLASGGSSRFVLEKKDKGKRHTGLMPHFGDKKLNDFKQSDLDEAAAAMYPDTTGDTRNRQFYTPFIAIWTHAVKNKWADPQSWQRPRKAKGTSSRSTSTRSGTAPVTYDRAAEFVAAMSPAPAMVMTFLFYTGLRPIEAFALESSDINLAKLWGIVRSSKTGEPRGFPIHEFLAEWLGQLVERGGILFRTPRGEAYKEVQGGGGGLKTAIILNRGRLERAGNPINDISPYTGRHTVSTQLVVNGVHAYIKDQILGHAVDDMSRRYTNVPQQPLIDAINTLPVPDSWRKLPWVADPIGHQGDIALGRDPKAPKPRKS
ncbi:tyrosine-type recombinase/integrase [Mesorhizobium sp. LSHC414A00]|uniref:tyrosine-type recombinase/integrase n=1 Tax=Mesorhizobium sp. LSHC414A00 TaxID=1287287 RepID=UPI0003CE3FDB|nr:tyrosine-type recombinase/integrase [Mesorhizobium sp. LSHC414A00]ESX78271.1 integrase [Mesorhizobium sp. LSHC414A00]